VEVAGLKGADAAAQAIVAATTGSLVPGYEKGTAAAGRKAVSEWGWCGRMSVWVLGWRGVAYHATSSNEGGWGWAGSPEERL
jgi:hypothetical protein